MDEHEHPLDITIDRGRRVETMPWVVEADDQLGDSHNGSVCVHPGARFVIESQGTHNGSLTFQPGSEGRILGTHNGSLHLAAGADFEVIGAQNGSVHVEDGAELRT